MKTPSARHLLFIFPLIFLPLVPLGAFDFGLIVNNYAGVFNHESEETGFEYRSDITPRVSSLIGDNGEFIVTAGVTVGVEKSESYVVPELLHSGVSFRWGAWGLNAGRIPYADPLGFIASGLFDGVKVTHNASVGTFNAGVWYTGLLYKQNVNITMTPDELALYDTSVDYDHFADTYFAPRRLLASVDWDHPSVMRHLQLKAAVSMQVDLSDRDEKYHSQYITIKASAPVNHFMFELGGSLEMAEYVPGDFNVAFAVDGGIFWNLPTTFNSRLSLTGRYASGQSEGTGGAFIPVTHKFYGTVLKARLPGMSIYALDFTARIARPLGAGLSAAYFIRTDWGTYTAYPVDITENDGYFLGPELSAKLVWSPFSDVQFNVGGGVFLPALGDAGPDRKSQWRVELSAIIALL
jgi:hypothetical protein